MKIAVTTKREPNEGLNIRAKYIAKELELPYIERDNLSIEKTISKEELDYLLVVERDNLVLKGLDSSLFWHPNMAELKIKSIKKGNKEAIMDATGLKEGKSILDCTLGLAGDSLVFSTVVGKLGRVVGLEINKYIAYITKTGLENYGEDIEVLNESYVDYLKAQPDSSFDVIYFDPMFKEPNKKSTSINSFRAFAEHKGVTKDIIGEALRVCKERVVVKERRGVNNFEELGIKCIYGGKKDGAIVYGVIEKR